MTSDAVVLRFGEHRVPRPLRRLAIADIAEPGDVDPLLGRHRRLVVLGDDAELAVVLTRLLRLERLDVEVGHARGRFAARRAAFGTARRVPLIRDETGTVLVGEASWRGSPAGSPLVGEAIVDDTVLFDGDAPGVRIEPIDTPPGLRAAVLSARGRPLRWVTGRAAQLGTLGAEVVRDGVPAGRPVRRSTFYRHVTGWLRVG
ncbi:hypothetical protein LV457_07560 [Mycobacterium sp. MYCO198283]|uniref:hypothetical protein n=1 Tax=Mycobacterium sp. MYCO198283 TaxID=2883505 RepID=UPI001E658A46|nr:hypothetical protein [Mycobacterium sp. MYCO198283]MCG5432148.1 hypothetical protein [Mycobacterium sp. MYCO198283]